MGATYRYVNHDLRQSFDCGLGRWNSKWSGVGCNAGARALGILLSRTWGSCRIALVGDFSDEFELLRTGYEDITVDVAVMLLESDGASSWLDLNQPDDLQYAGDLALHLKLSWLATELDTHKKHWRQLQAKLPPNSFTVDVLQAAGRSLIKL